MSIMIIIILFIYSSYLTLEKYIVTGHIFRLRKNDISPREPAPGNIPESEETPEVTAPENIVGKSNFQIGQSATIADNSGQEEVLQTQLPENIFTFTPQSPSQQSLQPTFPSWLQQSGQGFGRGNNQNQQDNNAEFPLKFPPSDSEYQRWWNLWGKQQEYPSDAATMSQLLKGTDMERLLRANILGSSQKIKRYMDLYIGQNGGRPLTQKTKETILDIFDIEEYV